MGERQVPIDNPFNQMGWKKILFKDFSEFLDVFVETRPCVVDLVDSIKKSAGETQFVGIRYKTKIISLQAPEDFLTVNTCDRKMGLIVDQNIEEKISFLELDI